MQTGGMNPDKPDKKPGAVEKKDALDLLKPWSPDDYPTYNHFACLVCCAAAEGLNHDRKLKNLPRVDVDAYSMFYLKRLKPEWWPVGVPYTRASVLNQSMTVFSPEAKKRVLPADRVCEVLVQRRDADWKDRERVAYE